MWPFGNQYDILVVNYKIVIRENLAYKKTKVVAMALFSIMFAPLFILLGEAPHSTEVGLSIFLIVAGVSIYLYRTQRCKCMIEIDNDAKTIRVREKYDINPNNVTCIKVLKLHGKGSSYIYDYLALISDSETETGIYKIIRGSIDDKEIANIAHLIAQKLNLELIIDVPDLPSFRSLFSCKKKPEKEEVKKVTYEED
ncbi:MAG: hypothetical protein RLZZ367_1526 [Bacteroidota bacterium]|jgi:hypothetical protein